MCRNCKEAVTREYKQLTEQSELKKLSTNLFATYYK